VFIDVHARTHAGETALHLAAASGHFDICKMLLQRTGLQLKGPAARLHADLMLIASDCGWGCN
jgi:ankyrin repeat protein